MKSNSALKVDLLTAAPSANGFYRAGRVKGLIPGVYRVNEEKLLAKAEPNLELREYSTEGSTFHAKGAWLYDENGKVEMSVIGSSNFSYRSNRRDTEC